MQVLAFLISFTGLATIAVILRLWTRLRLRSAGWDDLLIVVALAANLVLLSCRVALYLSLPFYHLTLLTSKLSALALYTRLFRLRRVLLTSYSLAILLTVAGIWIIPSAFLFCLPVHDFWSLEQDAGQHCLPKKAVWVSNGAIQIATHVVVLAIPLVVIPTLTLRRRVKGGLFLLFGVGLVVVVISIIQLVTVIEILTRGGDLTHKSRTTALLASTEASASIICACMPPLYPLFSRACSRCAPIIDNIYHWAGGKGVARPHHPHLQTVSIHLTRPVVTDNPIFFDGFRVGGGSYSASVEVMVPSGGLEDGEGRGERGVSVLRTVDVNYNFERGGVGDVLGDRDTDRGWGVDLADLGEKGEGYGHGGKVGVIFMLGD
ncbi:hypothetical protein BO86DRAFT_434418 [Aspergillus japonicus CBS 114.51]|uniref:Rhodopsin domain-containing protein n=2 Tax=Aspergillus TaxID=5052 RepID=A0A2V5H4Q3_ASPV1|nr:hypothetical protein BO86DRAFT_434418 [Aspergillus japonicus CBS 114.51]PYI18481.1 hypothetical protein BO99DRAFT_461000 [Aspergillus violaceofuscus CBS 115571]RAH85961.1 hypothetical protein BO86DRAFT_434418 [Aspergillus japonicus CBS 114.51]